MTELSDWYDVCVIGGGPAGYAAAMRAWDYGKRVCLIERGPLGGAGVHAGALSSKTFWELSRDFRRAQQQDRGFRVGQISVDFPAVSRVVSSATWEKAEQLREQLDRLRELDGRMVLRGGTASLLDHHTVRLVSGATVDTVKAHHIVVATGSRPRVLPSLPIDGERVMTSDHVGTLGEFPDSMVIVGAGVTGCEFATVFANYGQTRVSLIDRAARILPYEDEDIATVCEANLASRGVHIHHHATLESIESRGERVAYTVSRPDGSQETHEVDCALVSIGRVPNTEGLNLREVGVELCDRGYVIDDDTRTSVDNIYAVGDVTQDVALVAIGEMEGRRAVDHMYDTVEHRLVYDSLSTIMFLDPEVAAVGLNELQARQREIPYRVARYGYDLCNRAIAMRATRGFVKILVTDDREMKVLGMRALGVHASTMIEGVALAIHQGLSVRVIAEMLHPHPAVTEALLDCCRMLAGTSIKKPRVFTQSLRLARIHYDTAGNVQTTDLCERSLAELGAL